MSRLSGLRLTILMVIAVFAVVVGGALVVATSQEPESRAASAEPLPAAAKVVDPGASRSSVPQLEKVASIATLRRAARKRRKTRRARRTATARTVAPASTPEPRAASTPVPEPVTPRVIAPQPAAPQPAPRPAAPRPVPRPRPRPAPKRDTGKQFDSSGESFDSAG